MTTTAPTARDAWPLLLARLDHARAATDSLFGLLRDEAFYDRSIGERHRIGFYRGHLDAFDWNLLNGRLFDRASVNPEYDHLFAFGIDPIDGQLPSDQVSDWPLRSEVERYCWSVRDVIDHELRRVERHGVDPQPSGHSPALLLNVAIEHRLMHAETLAYLLHQLPLERKVKGHASQAVEQPLVPNGRVAIPAGTARLGMPAEEASSFGWCNEFDGLDVEVPAFVIDKNMVSNGEFLAFVEAGGYRDPRFWSEAGWAWREAEGFGRPVFWQADASGWRLRTMFDEIALPLNWPVYVSHAEASAYARWAGKTLPSEAQWQRAAGTRRPRHGNFDFAYFDPVAVDADLHERSDAGVVGMWGNGWEWTDTVFAPLPGFKAFECYPGYSANFFDGQHYVLKGGSPRTASCMIRPSFRNWFQPHYQYVYAGFRCVHA
jgi:gamma-glutamyl hercynylcysteine S-oxide synthase